jgi:L-ascorbate metabolism protein UlaG (beta-lactamase superfamily)
MPDEGVKAFKDLNAKKYFPIHWGMFELALHTWYDPIESLHRASKVENFDLIAPKLGQIVNLDNPEANEMWWEQRPEEKFAFTIPIKTAIVDS